MHELPTIAPTKERHPSPFESFLEHELPRQYEEQARLLDDLGFLQILPESGKYGIVDEEGKEYPFPEYEDIKQEIRKNKEVFEKKFNQGFTELRITPFALPIQRFFDAIEEELKRQYKNGILKSTNKDKLDLDTKEPLYRWGGYQKQTPVYFPTDLEKKNHGGKTKQELLDSSTSSFPGFLVSFEEASQNIPREGQGETEGGRPRLEAGKSAQEYLKLLKTKPYEHESGLTIEDYAIRFLSALHKDGTVIDDWGNENASVCLNFATLFPEEGEHGVVSGADWGRDVAQANVGGDDVAARNPSVGSRSLVRVGNL